MQRRAPVTRMPTFRRCSVTAANALCALKQVVFRFRQIHGPLGTHHVLIAGRRFGLLPLLLAFRIDRSRPQALTAATSWNQNQPKEEMPSGIRQYLFRTSPHNMLMESTIQAAKWSKVRAIMELLSSFLSRRPLPATGIRRMTLRRAAAADPSHPSIRMRYKWLCHPVSTLSLCI